ncbi:MAG: hypothetical protein U1F83_00145 [Verrucomicrobiota bacterium]
MKKSNAIMLSVVCIMTAFGFMVLSADSSKSADISVPLPGPRSEDLDSLNSVLFALAAERYAVVKSHGESWILTTHTGSQVLKVTDGSRTIVSIPIPDPADQVGLCCYVKQFNSFVENEADALVLGGQYKDGETLFRLLLRFDSCGGLWRENLQKKLNILQRVIGNSNPTNELKEFESLCVKVNSHLKLARIQEMRATVVTNLLETQLIPRQGVGSESGRERN